MNINLESMKFMSETRKMASSERAKPTHIGEQVQERIKVFHKNSE